LSADESTTLTQEWNWDATLLTDSRSEFQLYPLDFLNQHLEIAQREQIRELNLISAPISVSEIYQDFHSKPFNNLISANPKQSDYRSLYAPMFGSNSNYTFSKSEIIQHINNFLKNPMV
jgi:hypothetical protein